MNKKIKKKLGANQAANSSISLVKVKATDQDVKWQKEKNMVKSRPVVKFFKQIFPNSMLPPPPPQPQTLINI